MKNVTVAEALAYVRTVKAVEAAVARDAAQFLAERGRPMNYVEQCEATIKHLQYFEEHPVPSGAEAMPQGDNYHDLEVTKVHPYAWSDALH